MTPEQWQRAKALFHDALDQPESRRLDWLNAQYPGDRAGFEVVAKMLAAEAEPSFESPPLPLSLDVVFNPDWPSGKRVGSYRILKKLAPVA